MPITGSDFEKLVQPFFKEIFEKMGFLVIQVRKQDSGDQNGFDISVLFLDDNEYVVLRIKCAQMLIHY